MKANELMIGDWVRLVADDSNECLQVSYVRHDGVGFKQYSHFFDEIEPIPLTEEILKANGFEYREFTSGESMHYNHSVTVYLNKDGDIFMLIGGEQRWMKYVHELQQALRLCGLNELAENFRIA